jgi:hypothetical protein
VPFPSDSIIIKPNTAYTPENTNPILQPRFSPFRTEAVKNNLFILVLLIHLNYVFSKETPNGFNLALRMDVSLPISFGAIVGLA